MDDVRRTISVKHLDSEAREIAFDNVLNGYRPATRAPAAVLPWTGNSARGGDNRVEPLRDLGGHLSFCGRSVFFIPGVVLCLCGPCASVASLRGVKCSLATYVPALQVDHVVDVAVDLRQEFNGS